jgi:hypothetical protein
MLDDSNAQSLMSLAEVQTLRSEWKRQFLVEDDQLKFRAGQCLMCGSDRM